MYFLVLNPNMEMEALTNTCKEGLMQKEELLKIINPT